MDQDQPVPGIAFRYADSVDELDALEPLWNALQEHHERITPDLGAHTPKRDTADAWRIRRSKYELWLGAPETFVVIAESDGQAIGYALVTVGIGFASWDTGERLAQLETLSVLPDHRSFGVGARLLDLAWERLEQLGIDGMQITTTTTNVDAQRLYERQGFEQSFVVYYGKRDDPGVTAKEG
ncbi:MAG TPA: GNAT family N-acetyltransferase [Solirubrobacterales bacterium]|jgi:ribosomal protein S18 acetylase RimI-like enzyme